VKAIFGIVITLLLSALCFFGAYSQGTSNKGTEFWTCYMDHIDPPTGTTTPSSMILYITSDISTTGNVTIADGSFSQAFTVTANAVTFVTIPGSAFLGTGGQFLKGIHITSANAIAVYAHIYASSVSGATLLLPVNTMGKSYLSLNYTQLSNATAYSAFDVIATEDTTTVSITPSAALTTGQPAGKAFTVTLNKGELYQGLSATDLTGSIIQSISTTTGVCKKIAVFSGSSKIGIGCNATTPIGKGTSDNLFQQVYPTSAWGKNYITAHLANRPYDIYRIILSTPNTNVTLNGTLLTASQFTGGGGLYYEFNSTTTNVISADQPIQVIQYTPTETDGLNCTTLKSDVGDPEMIYLSPIEQGLSRVTLYSTGYYKILQSYINVIIPTSAVSSFTLDGSPYTSFTAVTNDTAYSYAQIPVSSGPQATGGGSVTSGTHTIAASQAFNAIAYGFGSDESYGYAAGTNLQDLNEFVEFQNPVNDTVQTGGCAGVNYNLQVTIPYQTTNISWNFEDGTTPYVDSSPTVKSTTVKGTQTLYTYQYPKPVSYTAGSHSVVATVFDPVADVCGSNETIEFDFTITNPPNTGFTVAPNTCFGDSTAFKDTTTVALGNYEKSWLWNFGDGKTSTLQNPVHLYTAPGNYTVSLTVTDNNGCSTVSAPVSIHISALPVANFTSSNPDCVTQNITFTDKSTSTDGTIIKWVWSFGDGVIDTLVNNTPFTHSYDTTGTDTVKLMVISNKGCSSGVFSQIISIKPLPVVDFVLPDICLDDAYAQFTDETTIADSTQSAFTYLWNFGDSYSTTANNTSTLMNPRHKYSQEGPYTATLTVTSKYGCAVSKAKTFTVNGTTPKAAFSVENSGFLCSSDSVTFDDQSTVDFGNITKLVWFFDYTNNPTDSVVYADTALRTDRKYRHFYGLNNTTNAQSYQVQLFAYSGQTCFNPVMQNIVVNPNPVVILSPSGSVSLCQANQPLQITATPNIPGTGVFSGTGVSSTGLFDPKVSGTGTFIINYLYTATTTGCTYATSMQITVNPTPVVSVTATIDYLAGGQVTLDATASITSGTMTYKWSPSTGLSEDDILNPVASPTDNTTYTLTVTSDKFCSTTVQTMVNVLKGPVVPNTFTPNGDGINDTWDIKYLDQYPNCTVRIVNRYGTQVYFSHNYPIPWDGKYKGADLPAGVYYYIINPGSGRTVIAGFVTIIR